ncbi:MAG: GTPase HflX [Candidatus Electryonea clarkiae]|nr:GTPase HflX [Candidatus Electryonea clarkiae]MDP8286682.1 GTPase HflX [Candidatus Electryonea clarkiae]
MALKIHTVKNTSGSENQRESAVLVAVIKAGDKAWIVEDHLAELASLADTAGADVAETVIQRRMKLNPATMIGAGKVSELASICKRHKAALVIFDDDLTPVQVRNLESQLPGKVLDRSGLILDIFASRARSKEAKVQVELAQNQYYYPRLTRQWSHLKGQQGGIGFRGPGETQLEVDRRAVQRKITHLKKELKIIARQRSTRRKKRHDTPTAALVGYTNVGKSSLLNALTGKEDAFVEDRLFATLDSKVRRVAHNPDKPMLVIDTVGFIRKLPHHLVASFRSTLEETGEADLIIHVSDISHPQVEAQMLQTDKVLEDLELDHKPLLLVFNKADAVTSSAVLKRTQEKYPEALIVSAKKGIRIWELCEKMERLLYQGSKRLELVLSPARLNMLDNLSDQISITRKEWEDGSIRVVLTGPDKLIKSVMYNKGLRKEEIIG